ncbi:glycosyltransferase [Ralstonia sp. CHL-2022]|uniref:Glycosyltransferase n=1 Tax=Ralstonia mojiangensis TaxID=2953895 RepID=A0AAE3LE31_9RALS|nr:glycosyltransferase [Ralstonia mojiangensis]MCT7317136.1 glycosyltransferase [Ralstonia mojiangensis]
MRPLLSIVIPSSNRQHYLASVIETLLRVTQAEVIVRDNSDQPLSEAALAPLQMNSRLTYAHDATKISVVDNFERALAMASGEYLMFIGDDDCVGPCVEEIAAWAKVNDIDAIVSYTDRFIANYFWPGVRSKYFADGYAGKLFISPSSGRVENLDAMSTIVSAANRPGGGLRNMPRAYHGLISRRVVDRVIEKNGHLFGGVSPDIYSAVMLSAEARRAVRIDYPFVIPGASAQSTAGEGAARQDQDDLRARDHIKRFGPRLIWEDRVPEFYSPENVWTYSLQRALSDRQLVGCPVNYPRLYAKLYFQYPARRDAIKQSANLWISQNGYLRFGLGALRGAYAELLLQFRRVWFRFGTPPTEIAGLETVGAAYDALSKAVPVWQPPKP